MNLKLLCAPIALTLICQWIPGAFAKPQLAEKPAVEQQPPPSIRFLRPLKDERFFDYPIFVQVDVDRFQLVAPTGQANPHPRPHTGHIAYSMDDYPVVATDDTQFMIGKKLGDVYLPVGLHVLKAQLVDENGKPLDPPVVATTELFTGHPAVVEAIHTTTGSARAELTGQELYQMRVHLEELEKDLKKLKAGDAGFTPSPVSGGQTE